MPAVTRISAKETKRLLSALQVPHRPDGMAYYGVYAYDLPDGRVLVDWQSYGHLFGSMMHLREVYQKLQKTTARHILEGVCTFEPDFLVQAPLLAARCLQALNLPGRGMTLSVLQEVDHVLNQRPCPISLV